MFYHGINREYIYQAYPVLSPRKTAGNKNPEQLADRRHLLEQFGLEPIHLLEESPTYPRQRCIAECLAFGDTVIAFGELPLPIWQLSQHEIGVTILDLRQAVCIYTSQPDERLVRLFAGIPVRSAN
ncbi:hypothetical protein [Brevibacillus fulvus]|uniref:Uncharacterized protein n=1 Tax=Brevibacillus fulvus TaxID=1125967 RepID=A0A938XU03_9BACL|nr:hypothetical protein [Brevibacillus fulvus]MBM7590077.1 hypothetical protein [Brevibacillus fulvus]